MTCLYDPEARAAHARVMAADALHYNTSMYYRAHDRTHVKSLWSNDLEASKVAAVLRGRIVQKLLARSSVFMLFLTLAQHHWGDLDNTMEVDAKPFL